MLEIENGRLGLYGTNEHSKCNHLVALGFKGLKVKTALSVCSVQVRAYMWYLTNNVHAENMQFITSRPNSIVEYDRQVPSIIPRQSISCRQFWHGLLHQPRFKIWRVHPPSLPSVLSLPSFPVSRWPVPWSQLGVWESTEPGRQTISVHFEVKSRSLVSGKFSAMLKSFTDDDTRVSNTNKMTYIYQLRKSRKSHKVDQNCGVSDIPN